MKADSDCIVEGRLAAYRLIRPGAEARPTVYSAELIVLSDPDHFSGTIQIDLRPRRTPRKAVQQGATGGR
jgi:hypothetical protein